MTTQELIIWSPHKNQAVIADDPARFKVIRCGRRFGKTTLAISLLEEEALLKPDSLFYYIAPTYKQAKSIAWDMLLMSVRDLPKVLVDKTNESELYVQFANGSRIFIKGADNPDSLRGVGLNGAVLDEYADMKPNVYDEIIEPALADKEGFAIFIGTPKGFNHFYTLFTKAETLDGWSTYHFTTYDNPLIKTEEIDRIRKKTPEDTFAQEFLAEFRKMEGLVYPEFDRNRHTVDEIDIHFHEVIMGVDFGYTNPAAMLVIGRDFDNRYFVLEEYYKKGKTNPELLEVATNLQKVYNVNVYYPDPAEPDRIKEMEDAGLPCREVNKDIALGIDHVRRMFKENRLFIHKDCKHLIWELERYHYPDNKRETYNEKELPVKKDDHAVDALRYALFMNAPVDTINNDDFNLYGTSY